MERCTLAFPIGMVKPESITSSETRKDSPYLMHEQILIIQMPRMTNELVSIITLLTTTHSPGKQQGQGP